MSAHEDNAAPPLESGREDAARCRVESKRAVCPFASIEERQGIGQRLARLRECPTNPGAGLRSAPRLWVRGEASARTPPLVMHRKIRDRGETATRYANCRARNAQGEPQRRHHDAINDIVLEPLAQGPPLSLPDIRYHGAALSQQDGRCSRARVAKTKILCSLG
jgi:hypothetical protein